MHPNPFALHMLVYVNVLMGVVSQSGHQLRTRRNDIVPLRHITANTTDKKTQKSSVDYSIASTPRRFDSWHHVSSDDDTPNRGKHVCRPHSSVSRRASYPRTCGVVEPTPEPCYMMYMMYMMYMVYMV